MYCGIVNYLPAVVGPLALHFGGRNLATLV
jgi:hypothetical protein